MTYDHQDSLREEERRLARLPRRETMGFTGRAEVTRSGLLSRLVLGLLLIGAVIFLLWPR